MFKNLKKLNVIAGITLVALIGLSFSTSHPTTSTGGYTTAPGDNSCSSSSCHSGSNTNLDGEVNIEGLPTTIIAGQTYVITVRITNPNGNAAEAGFQLLALNGTNGNAGTMASNSTNTSIKVASGKNYFGHEPSVVFPASNVLTHTVTWTAPAVLGTVPEIKFYAAANIADGNNARTNDRIVFDSQFVPIALSPNPLDANITNLINPTCFNSTNGRATAVATGGSGSYTYLWSSGQTTATATNLPGGSSTVTVSDGNSQVVKTLNLVAPPDIVAVASAVPTCQGVNNGAATVIANGGTGSLTYTWSNNATTQSISNLAAGNYTVTVIDANLCTKTATTTVSISPPMTISGTINQVACNGSNTGSIISSVSGGIMPFTYLWSNGQTTSSVTSLPAGVYNLTVTDAASCTKTASYTITQPSALSAVVSINNQVLCNSGNNGSATLTVSGGSPGYNFTWSTGQTGTGSSSTINNLSAGNYTVTVIDLQDCEKIANFTISQPAVLVVAGLTNNVSCNGDTNGSINVTPVGGTSPYNYSWSNGQTSQNISNLSPGSYTLITKDANQCQNTKTFSITAPPVLEVTIDTIAPILCSGASTGSLIANPTGGNSGYIYLWSNGATTSSINNLAAGTFKVTVRDSLGCLDSISANLSQPAPIAVTVVNSTPASCQGLSNGSLTINASNTTGPYTYQWMTGQTGATLSNVAAGSYQVTITDNTNCTSLRIFSIQNAPPFQINSGIITNVRCFGDSTGIAAIMPSNNLSYRWSTGATSTSISMLPAGIVSVIATDTLGCKSDTLRIEISQNQRIMPEGIMLKNVLCANEEFGFVSIDTLVGGLGSIEYEWITADTILVLDSLVEDTLSIGTHTLLLVDSIGCTESYPYQVFKAPLINITKEVHQPSCFGEMDGAIEPLISGGFLKTTTLWSNGSTNDSLYGLGMGTYILSVIDSASCVVFDTAIITMPALLTANVNAIAESEAGNNDGSIKLVPQGGTGPFTVVWSNGRTEFELDSLVPMEYFYILTDARGCMTEGAVTVLGGGCNLGAMINPVNPSCFDSNDGSIGLTLPLPIEDYKIILTKDGAITSQKLDELSPGLYVVIIENAVGCLAILQNILLTEVSPRMSISSFNHTKPSSNLNNGIIELAISGGTAPLIYTWSFNGLPFNQNTQKITGLNSGIYGLTVTDSLGCTYVMEPFTLEKASSTEDENKFKLNNYPNPVFNTLHINATVGSEIHIFNQNGKLVSTYTQTNDNHVIDVSTWTNGLYYLKARNKGKYLNGRFTILH